MSTKEILNLHEIKSNALQQFLFVDEETIAITASKPFPLHRLKPTSAIVVTGYIPLNASRFSVNLLCKNAGNNAFHFNARLDRDYVVRNTKFSGKWEDEETCSPFGNTSNQFRRNSYIHILIFCTTNEFQVAVNGEHFCGFAYRMPLEEVNSIEINGSFEDIKFRQLDLFTYPDPKNMKSLQTLYMDQPIVDFPSTPILVNIQNRFASNTKIYISGRLKLLPHSFYINLQKGKTIYPHPIIALHLNARFSYGSVAPYVVLNCWSNGSWGEEERHQGHLRWMPGHQFLLTIHCEYETYSIWLGEKMIGEFKHRLMPAIIDTIKIAGDVVLNELKMSFVN